jgi:molybdate-binding protein/DNA-binding XRE family transcriptional regulator
MEVRVRARRRALGLTQGTLAERAGLARQTVNAIELGSSAPSTEVALRLAAVLDCRVEDLFRLPERGDRLIAEVAGTLDAGSRRVALAQLDGRWLARPLASLGRAADGLATPLGPGRAEVELLAPREDLAETVFGLGCDPAMAVLGGHLGRGGGPVPPGVKAAGGGRVPRLHWFEAGSTAALAALARGEAHLAGSHLLDQATATDTIAAAAALLGGAAATVVTFAHWEEGLIVAAGNPKGIGGVADLARPGVRLVNREEGSGSRLLLDAQLRGLGIGPEIVDGYGRLARGHLAVARAIAAGAADVGLGIRAAAAAEGLDFLPLREERYDLVIPDRHLDHPGIRRLLDTLQTAGLRREIAALPGYDPREMGRVAATLGAARHGF